LARRQVEFTRTYSDRAPMRLLQQLGGEQALASRSARVYLNVRHVAPRRALHAAGIPIDGTDRRVVDPDPAAAAQDIGVVVPAVQCAARVHHISHQSERRCSAAAFVRLLAPQTRWRLRINVAVPQHLTVVVAAIKAQQPRCRGHFCNIARSRRRRSGRSANFEHRRQSDRRRVLCSATHRQNKRGKIRGVRIV
jgi:hypothetical protein